MYLCRYSIFGFEYILLSIFYMITIIAFGLFKVEVNNRNERIHQQQGTFG